MSEKSPIIARLTNYKHHSPRATNTLAAAAAASRKNGQYSSSLKKSPDFLSASLARRIGISGKSDHKKVPPFSSSSRCCSEQPTNSSVDLFGEDDDSDLDYNLGSKQKQLLEPRLSSDEEHGDKSPVQITTNRRNCFPKRNRISSSESSQENPGSPPWIVRSNQTTSFSKKSRKKPRVAVISDSDEDSETEKATHRHFVEDITRGATTKEQLALLRKQKQSRDLEQDEEEAENSGSSSDIQKAIEQSLAMRREKPEDSIVDLTGECGSPEKIQNGTIYEKVSSNRELEDKCLEFFNRATLDELSNTPKCGAKMTQILLSVRPFSSYDDLVNQFECTRGLSMTAVDAYWEQLDAKSNLERVLCECSRRSAELQNAVQRLMTCSDADKQRKQSSLLNEKFLLKPYQKIGLNWLVLMHKQKLNAILADEMGLGKTIQVIAFLAYLRETSISGRSVHLIVVPSSTIDNWHFELHRWWPSVRVLNYYGGLDDRLQIRADLWKKKYGEVDVILTTYNMVTSKAEDRSFFRRFQINYVIYDEAHMLKNFTTKRYRCLLKIRSQRKLLLTGTPLQNNLVELMSLMYFVLPDLFRDFQDDMGQILNLFQQKNGGMGVDYGEEKIKQAKQIMMPFVLRRLKEDVLSQLPTKTEKVLRCPLAEKQQRFYDQIIDSCRKNKDQLCGGRGVKILMELRKAANHPLLLRRFYTGEKLDKMSCLLVRGAKYRDSDPLLVKEDMELMTDFELNRLCKENRTICQFCIPEELVCDSGKFRILDELLPEYKAKEEKVLLFSQFTMVLDILEEYLKARGHEYLRLDGQTPVVERQGLINQFNRDGNKFVFLLSTRAGGLGINLTSASVIILHDIDYNPYNDKQAEDRCHRVGQTKEVTVLKLIGENTIEENMLSCAKRKLELEVQVTRNRGQSTAYSENSEDDNQTVESLLKAILHL